MTEKGIRETLLERAGRARSLDPDDVMDTIIDLLRDDPSLIEELAPGMSLRKRPVSHKERIRRMNEARVKNVRERVDKRHAKIIPIIKYCLEKQPGISLREIGIVLDRKGIKPSRSASWSPASVLAIMRKAGLSGSSEA